MYLYLLKPSVVKRVVHRKRGFLIALGVGSMLCCEIHLKYVVKEEIATQPDIGSESTDHISTFQMKAGKLPVHSTEHYRDALIFCGKPGAKNVYNFQP